jgi:nitroimidazol reductase NimA-like FMN-containing flavoprotein (pyridoxamine 5'-phosphate oxidase superfamily)/osmotically-inducible protein OsmY
VTAPRVDALERDQSERILTRNRVGRLAFTAQGRVNILPLHYRYEAGWIYGRTQPGGKLLLILRNRRVAFEVDEHEGAFDWRSVVAHGTFYIIDPGERKVFDRAVELLRDLFPATSTAGDPTPFRTHFFRINVTELTGRAATPTGGHIIEASSERPTETAVAEEDIALRKAAQNAVGRIESVDVANVTVEAMDGILLLGGVVETQHDAAEVERAAAAVRGARVVVVQIEVDAPDPSAPDPVDLAHVVNQALSRLPSWAAADDVRVIIEHGWLRAEGKVGSASAHADILRELRSVRGARGLIDRISVG